FVANNQWRMNAPAGPFIPHIDMDVGPADAGLMYPDEYIVLANLRLGHLIQREALAGRLLLKGRHGVRHVWLGARGCECLPIYRRSGTHHHLSFWPSRGSDELFRCARWGPLPKRLRPRTVGTRRSFQQALVRYRLAISSRCRSLEASG